MATKDRKQDGGVVGKLAGRGEEALTRVMEGLGRNPRVTDAVDRAMSAKGRLDEASRSALNQVGLAAADEIRELRSQLEQVRGRLRFLDDQTAFATISLSLRERLPDAAPGGDDGGILDAWADGARAFGNVAAGTFVVLATIAPVLLLLALVALAVRIALRRGLVPRRRVTDRA